jgi:hypothetical protein
MRIRSLLLAAILALCVVCLARATTLVRLSLNQLTQASSAIVRGRVLSQESRWDPAHTRIVTLTTIAVAETLKGAPPTTLVVQQLGGTVGHIRLHVSGTVHFHPDTDYVLFLEPAGTDTSKFLVVGMMQGAYRIYRDAMTREERVIRPLAGFYAGAPGGGGPSVSQETMPLGAFRQQVAGAVQSPVLIPRGTSLPLIVESTESRGVERLRVLARTATTLYPNPGLVIPAGSTVEGSAQLVSGVWRIHWTDLVIRGTRVEISATSEEPRDTALRGRMLVVSVR